MTTKPKNEITTEKATGLLNEGQPLIDKYVGGELKIETNEIWLGFK